MAERAEKSARGSDGVGLITLERRAELGNPLISFDILTGDQLFVDRLTYHFVPPQVGQGFVFRTGNITGIGQDQYYIKRLIGTPRDTIEIRQPAVFRNGKPITGPMRLK